MQACNGGGCGPWSGTGTIDVLLPPSDAPSLSVPGSSTTGSYTVSWGWVATASSYTLQESINGGGWGTVQSGGATSWGVSSKGSGNYGYRVQACNAGGCGPWSGTGSVGVTLLPPVPQGLSATVIPPSYKGNYTVSFQAVSGASYYQLHERSDLGTVPTAILNLGAATSQTFGRPGVSDMVFYMVRACNTSGCSAWSDEVDVALGEF